MASNGSDIELFDIPSTSSKKSKPTGSRKTSKSLPSKGSISFKSKKKIPRVSNFAETLYYPEKDPFEVSDEDESPYVSGETLGPSTDTGSTPRRNKYKKPDKSRTKLLWNRRRSDGSWVFHPKLVKYFMTPDSPDYHDLKNKRFNTSFLHEKRRGPRNIEIFSPDELKGEIGVPLPKIPLPNITDGAPGEKYAHVFDNMPIDVELDEDIIKQKEEHKKLKRERSLLKKATGRHFKTPQFGRVKHLLQKIPDEHLVTNYEKIFGNGFKIEPEIPSYCISSPSSCENDSNDTLLPPVNTPSVDSSFTSSKDSYQITASQLKKIKNDPKNYDWVNELSDEGRLLNKEEMLRKQAASGTLNELRSDELAGCKGKKKSKSATRSNKDGKLKLTAETKKKQKPESVVGSNKKGKPKSTAGIEKKRKSKSSTGSIEKNIIKSERCNERKAETSASGTCQKKRSKSSDVSVVKRSKPMAGFKKQKSAATSVEKKLRSATFEKKKESHCIQKCMILPCEEIIDNRVLRVALHKLED